LTAKGWDMPVIQTASGLSIRTYEAPPDDFDPLTAADHLLRHYGLPARPDPGVSPELRRQWERVFSRRLAYITAEFSPADRTTSRQPATGTAEGPYTSTTWSGNVALVPKTGYSFLWIQGTWTVPNPYPQQEDNGELYVASQWIGIDGWNKIGNSIFQAGTETDVRSLNSTTTWRSCYAWWQWFNPAAEPDSTKISNLPVSPGDVISCLLCVNSPTSGTVLMLNVSSSKLVTLDISAPSASPPSSLVAGCAEWIIERPTPANSTTPGQLADYDVVYFDECGAAYNEGLPGNGNPVTQIDLTSGNFITMAVNNSNLSVPTYETPTLMKLNMTENDPPLTAP
jgi:Peptidase A4 family